MMPSCAFVLCLPLWDTARGQRRQQWRRAADESSATSSVLEPQAVLERRLEEVVQLRRARLVEADLEVVLLALRARAGEGDAVEGEAVAVAAAVASTPGFVIFADSTRDSSTASIVATSGTVKRADMRRSVAGRRGLDARVRDLGGLDARLEHGEHRRDLRDREARRHAAVHVELRHVVGRVLLARAELREARDDDGGALLDVRDAGEVAVLRVVHQAVHLERRARAGAGEQRREAAEHRRSLRGNQ
eukprot:CAMPEP_0174883076 /NCGR_PEP_ID=MMETSP1114-20130205/85085_1 /TAXON_ID=312471 /ORGANISM="Neobodo designis, Strain CCAP 1951/1" /LENGTH=246 /DNA_ID=CAMNT_0016118477 /DNA_START=115 /DNA_END=856 /DNA_ORIENTATION=-